MDLKGKEKAWEIVRIDTSTRPPTLHIRDKDNPEHIFTLSSDEVDMRERDANGKPILKPID